MPTDTERRLTALLREAQGDDELGPHAANVAALIDALAAVRARGDVPTPPSGTVGAQEAQRERTWRPMESAPKDGTEFVGQYPWGWRVVTWHSHHMCWWECGHGSIEPPRNWMPLPAAPVDPPREENKP